MKKFLKTITILGAVLLGGLVASPAAGAINVFQSCTNATDSAVCKSQNDSAAGLIEKVVNTMLFILAGVAVIMIVIGGIKYTTSSGDQSGVNSAKNTIMYAVIGLIVAIMAYAIVNFVINRIK